MMIQTHLILIRISFCSLKKTSSPSQTLHDTSKGRQQLTTYLKGISFRTRTRTSTHTHAHTHTLTVGTTLSIVKIDVSPLCFIWVVVKCLLCATRLITIIFLIGRQH